MMKLIIAFALFLAMLGLKAQPESAPIVFSDDLSIMKLTNHVYLYESKYELKNYGKVSSNGAIVIDGNSAILIDTPWCDSLTNQLILAVESKLNVKFSKAIVTHWHIDRMGGLQALIDRGIETISTDLTQNIAKDKGLPVPSTQFSDYLILNLSSIKLVCYYPGAGHTVDNCVVWVPSESILFGGCLIKESRAPDLGNIADAVLTSYPTSIKKLITKYSQAKIVIPGHGRIGGQELLTHTYAISLLK